MLLKPELFLIFTAVFPVFKKWHSLKVTFHISISKTVFDVQVVFFYSKA